MRPYKVGVREQLRRDVLRFIAASFPSVWALELLLSLKRERRLWTRQELVSTHRASELVVARGLDALVVARACRGRIVDLGLRLGSRGGIGDDPVRLPVRRCGLRLFRVRAVFLRFWRRTRDGLFLAFALAFGLLGLGQTILALANIPTEERGSLFLIRLAAFALILFAILRKNRSANA